MPGGRGGDGGDGSDDGGGGAATFLTWAQASATECAMLMQMNVVHSENSGAIWCAAAAATVAIAALPALVPTAAASCAADGAGGWYSSHWR
jgi:hypothetical protein